MVVEQDLIRLSSVLTVGVIRCQSCAVAWVRGREIDQRISSATRTTNIEEPLGWYGNMVSRVQTFARR